MPKFLVQNLSDKSVKLDIEPWADLEVLAPNGRAVFEYVEPAEIEFAVMGNDECVVGIDSDYVKVSTNDGEKIFRPPPGKWKRSN